MNKTGEKTIYAQNRRGMIQAIDIIEYPSHNLAVASMEKLGRLNALNALKALKEQTGLNWQAHQHTESYFKFIAAL